jgi:RNA polymerase sigma-70 factor (ECF subfamily)
VDDPDAERIRRCARGDAGAFRELYERYAPRLFGTAFRITGSRHDAEEALQEAFLKVHRRIGSFEFRAPFSLWLYRIVVHESLNLCRGRPRRVPPRPPQERTADEEDWAMSALAGLSPPLRAVALLRYRDGFSYQEIAEILEIPIGTVRSRLFEAHEQLRRGRATGEEAS